MIKVKDFTYYCNKFDANDLKLIKRSDNEIDLCIVDGIFGNVVDDGVILTISLGKDKNMKIYHAEGIEIDNNVSNFKIVKC